MFRVNLNWSSKITLKTYLSSLNVFVIQLWPHRHESGIDFLSGKTTEKAHFQKKKKKTSHLFVLCRGGQPSLEQRCLSKLTSKYHSFFSGCHFEQTVPSEFVLSRQRYESASQEIKEAVIVASLLKLPVQSRPVGKKAKLMGSESYDPLAVTGRKDMPRPTWFMLRPLWVTATPHPITIP